MRGRSEPASVTLERVAGRCPPGLVKPGRRVGDLSDNPTFQAVRDGIILLEWISLMDADLRIVTKLPLEHLW